MYQLSESLLKLWKQKWWEMRNLLAINHILCKVMLTGCRLLGQELYLSLLQSLKRKLLQKLRNLMEFSFLVEMEIIQNMEDLFLRLSKKLMIMALFILFGVLVSDMRILLVIFQTTDGTSLISMIMIPAQWLQNSQLIQVKLKCSIGQALRLIYLSQTT